MFLVGFFGGGGSSLIRRFVTEILHQFDKYLICIEAYQWNIDHFPNLHIKEGILQIKL